MSKAKILEEAGKMSVPHVGDLLSAIHDFTIDKSGKITNFDAVLAYHRERMQGVIDDEDELKRRSLVGISDVKIEKRHVSTVIEDFRKEHPEYFHSNGDGVVS